MPNKTRTLVQRPNCLTAQKTILNSCAKQPLIFTDLDGCLLNHDSYTFDEAWPALQLISAKSIPLIINSSKTETEILEFRRVLHNQHPFAVENGAAIFIPKDYFPGFKRPLNAIRFGSSRRELLEALSDLRARYAFAFESFTDLGPAKIAELTGLTLQQATMANQRIGSEPLRWLGNDESLSEFKKLLARKKMSLVEGGRFWHVMGQVDKVLAMRWLLKQFRESAKADFLSIVLGDSENDRRMLEAADVAVVIKTSSGKHLAVEKQGSQVIYTESPGARGWNEAIVQLLERTEVEHQHE